MTRSRWLLFAALVLGFALFLAFGPDEQTVIRESAAWREQPAPISSPHWRSSSSRKWSRRALGAGRYLDERAGGVSVRLLDRHRGGERRGDARRDAGVPRRAICVLRRDSPRCAQSRPRLERWLTAIDEGLHEHGAYYVLLLRLTPVIPFWALNLGLGLTRVRLRDYWWATQLGMLPATMVVVNAGASVAEITSLRDLLSWRVIGALCLLPLVPFVLHHTAGRWLTKETSHASTPISTDQNRRE